MARQTINTGSALADRSGDDGRSAFTKVNENFAELYLGGYTPQTAAELAAGITPTANQYEPGDAQRLGWSESNTGAQNATVLANAASVWSNGGPHIRLPAGTFSLSQFSVPSGRGLIISGEGPQKTFLDHSTSGSMFVLGADNIQQFVLRDLTIRPSASTTVLLDWSGDYQAYAFRLENCELHQGSSGNTSCIAFQVVGGSNSTDHQKHYFDINGLKIFGMGTGIKMDGSTAAANDLDARAVQIQGCADDGVLLNESSDNRIVGSIENCGDGSSAYCFNILGTTSGCNRFWGRLENTITPANLPYNVATNCDTNNYIHATLSATPVPANDQCIRGGFLVNDGKEFSNVERRMKGLSRILGAATTDYLLRFMLSTDTMSSFGLFGIAADGKHSWATGTNPSDWDTHLERIAVGALQAHGGVANRLSNRGNVTGAVAVNCANGWTHRLVLTGDVTIGEPTNPANGAVLRFILIQDGTGGRTVTFNAIFKKAGGAYTMTAGASTKDTISFVYSSDSAAWFEVGRSQALA